MKPHIGLEKIWFDDDIIELKVEVCDGESLFVNEVYVGYDCLGELTTELLAFREQFLGGIYDIRLGSFGPEFANGGFHARLHFQLPGVLLVSTHQESDCHASPTGEAAREAKMFLRSEPILLDRFISELKLLDSGKSTKAILTCT